MKQQVLVIAIWALVGTTSAQEIIPLWGKEIPNRKESAEKELKEEKDILWIQKVQTPTLEVFLPAKRNANGRALVICPGGGYHGLAYDWEGSDIAKWLNSMGIAGIVLKYRLPTSESVINPNEVPLQDAQRAMRLVRHHSEEWNIDASKIGIMGFSAGGHVASTLGTHFNQPNAFTEDPIDALNPRPDFMVLIYPVITFQPSKRHNGSMEALLGKSPDQNQIDHYSNELHVTTSTPPTFLVHSADDSAVPVENSIMFFEALNKAQVATEMHIYPTGGHGYGLGLTHPPVNSWPELMIRWMGNLEGH